MSTYQQLKELIMAQGIVHESDVSPDANLMDDLLYDHNDIAELIQMVEKDFRVQIEPEEFTSFAHVKAIIKLLNSKRMGQSLVESYSDYSSLS